MKRPHTRVCTGTPAPPASAAVCAESRCVGSPSPPAAGGSSAPRAAVWAGMCPLLPPPPPIPLTRPSSRHHPLTRRPSPEPAMPPGLGAPRQLGAADSGWKGLVRPECFTCKGLGEKWKQIQALGISLGVQHVCNLTQGCSKQLWAPSPHPTAEVWVGQPCSASQDSPCCTSSCSKAGSAFFSLTLPCFPYSRDATGSGLHPSSIQEP